MTVKLCLDLKINQTFNRIPNSLFPSKTGVEAEEAQMLDLTTAEAAEVADTATKRMLIVKIICSSKYKTTDLSTSQ
jgi:hypothetical protein